MTVAQAARAGAPVVLCVKVMKNDAATKRVRLPICHHEMTVALEVSVRSLVPCLECWSEARHA